MPSAFKFAIVEAGYTNDYKFNFVISPETSNGALRFTWIDLPNSDGVSGYVWRTSDGYIRLDKIIVFGTERKNDTQSFVKIVYF